MGLDPKKKDKAMKGIYRIKTDVVYDGCIPVTVYIVQRLQERWYGDKWINIRGYQDKKKAISLLELLGKIEYDNKK